MAVSRTEDPVTGGWYVYEYKVSDTQMNDYPKFGVWPNGYYLSVNQSSGGSTWAGAGAAALGAGRQSQVEWMIVPRAIVIEVA